MVTWPSWFWSSNMAGICIVYFTPPSKQNKIGMVTWPSAYLTFSCEVPIVWPRSKSQSLTLTYLQKNDPEKQHSRSKNCFNKFSNYGVTWSWHHWLKHIFNVVNCGFLDVYPFLRISVKLQIHSKNQRHAFSNFSLKIEAESVWRSFLLCQRNKRIFSWSCFCTYVHSILYGSCVIIWAP